MGLAYPLQIVPPGLGSERNCGIAKSTIQKVAVYTGDIAALAFHLRHQASPWFNWMQQNRKHMTNAIPRSFARGRKCRTWLL